MAVVGAETDEEFFRAELAAAAYSAPAATVEASSIEFEKRTVDLQWGKRKRGEAAEVRQPKQIIPKSAGTLRWNTAPRTHERASIEP